MTSDRHSDLKNLEAFITRSDNEITMILQSLQWNREKLYSNATMGTCIYNATHRVSAKKLKEHEEQCLLRIQGYTEQEQLLPEPLNSSAHSIVKLDSKDINLIIDNASKADSNFKKVKNDLESFKTVFTNIIVMIIPKLLKGIVWDGPAPLSLERLQATYTVDERRAIYDAVVASDPSSHDISDLALNDVNEVKSDTKRKSRIEILSELRDMRRRRTKYRVAAKTKKYSDVLRDVIKTQMEMYTGILTEHEDTLEKTAHSHKLDNIKRERSLSIESTNKQKIYHKPSTSERTIISRDEIKRSISLKTNRDTHVDERNRRDKYKERHYNMSYKGRSRENLDNRRNVYGEHNRNRRVDNSYDRNDYKRGSRYNKSKRTNENGERQYIDDHIKIKEEYESKNGSTGHKRNSRKH